MITEMGNSQNQPPGDFGEAIVAPVQEASKCSHLKDSQAEGEIHPTPDSHWNYPGSQQTEGALPIRKPVPLSATSSQLIGLTSTTRSLSTQAGASWHRQINTQYATRYRALASMGLLLEVTVTVKATTRSHATNFHFAPSWIPLQRESYSVLRGDPINPMEMPCTVWQGLSHHHQPRYADTSSQQWQATLPRNVSPTQSHAALPNFSATGSC